MSVDRDPRIALMEEGLWAGLGGGLAYDVGANEGQTIAEMLGRYEEVAAFEPAIESFTVCAERWQDDPRVMCRNLAVGDHDGILTVDLRQGPALSGQVTAQGMPYKGENLHEPGTACWGNVLETRQVSVATLDSLAGDYGVPDLVKVDTEGHEAQVLAGARDLLAARACKWIIEFHTKALREQCLEVLTAAGYVVWTVRAPHLDEGSYMWRNYGWLKAVPA